MKIANLFKWDSNKRVHKRVSPNVEKQSKWKRNTNKKQARWCTHFITYQRICDQIVTAFAINGTKDQNQSRYLLAVFTFQSKQHSLSTYYACLGHPILCGKPAGKRKESEIRTFKKKSRDITFSLLHIYMTCKNCGLLWGEHCFWPFAFNNIPSYWQLLPKKASHSLCNLSARIIDAWRRYFCNSVYFPNLPHLLI